MRDLKRFPGSSCVRENFIVSGGVKSIVSFQRAPAEICLKGSRRRSKLSLEPRSVRTKSHQSVRNPLTNKKLPAQLSKEPEILKIAENYAHGNAVFD
jgi:hypothetical protein